MPRNGSGTYSPPAGTAAVSLQPIASVPYNNFLTDISSEMTNSLPTTGVKAMGANLPMGGNKITNMADGSASSDGATMNNVNLTHGKIINIQLLTATGTYTKTAGAITGDLYLVGGGGAGGGAPTTGAGAFSIGAGGGSGAFTFKKGITLPASCSYTIGAGGTGVVGGAGNNGGQTGFNATYTANGGNGGSTAGPSTGVFTVGGASGGSAGATGDINAIGNPGMLALNATTGTVSGSGGTPLFMGWGRGGTGASLGPSSSGIAGSTANPGGIMVVEYT